MGEASRLICLDTVLVDVVMRVATLPERSSDVRARNLLITTGGGFNALSAATRQGVRAVYAGRLGTGPFADCARADLAAEGIDVPFAAHPELDTGICVVLSEPDGERTFVTAAGAEQHLRSADLAQLDVREGDVILLSGYNVMYPGLAEVVLGWLASLEGPSVIFDPADRVGDIPPENLDRTWSVTSWLSCNATEARHLTGVDDVTESAVALAEAHRGLRVVVRDGVRGCVLALPGEEPSRVAAFPVEAVDTNGAGDVFNGVFSAGLALGNEPRDAARWANAAAALAVASFGPATGPTAEVTRRFVASRSVSS